MKALLLAFAMAIAAALPASAQSLNPEFGTGNVRPFAYRLADRITNSSESTSYAEAPRSVSRTGLTRRKVRGVNPTGDEQCFISAASQHYMGLLLIVLDRDESQRRANALRLIDSMSC